MRPEGHGGLRLEYVQLERILNWNEGHCQPSEVCLRTFERAPELWILHYKGTLAGSRLSALSDAIREAGVEVCSPANMLSAANIDIGF